MTAEEVISFCLDKKGAEETYPFGADTLVVKVGGKMFALLDVVKLDSINLKCDPELAIELRERYEAVQPGYHMNKKHWNTVYFDGTIPVAKLKEWINHSYDLVVASLSAKIRSKLK